MKCIKIEYCAECPFCCDNKGKLHCVKNDKPAGTRRIPSWCGLENMTKPRKKKSVTTIEQETKVRGIVYDVHELYKAKCPGLKQYDIMSMPFSSVKNCLIGIRHIGDEKNIEKLFDMVARSDFLNGRSGNSWKADFTWLFRTPKGIDEWNADKVLKGLYSNKTNAKVSNFVDQKRTYGGWNNGRN